MNRTIMDYVVVSRNVIGRLLDVSFERGKGEVCLTISCGGKGEVGMRWVNTRIERYENK